MSTFLLALRNLLRNRRRSLMTLFAMTFGLVAVLLFGGYISYIQHAMLTGFVRLTGHLQIQHQGYHRYGSGDPSAYGVADYQRILDIVKRDEVLGPMLAVATPTLHFGGIAGNFSAGVSRTVFASGAVADEQHQMMQWNEFDMRVLSPINTLQGTAPDSAIVGTGVARVLRMCEPLGVPDCDAAPGPAAQQGDALPGDIAELAAGQRSTASAAPSAGGGTRVEILATSSRGAPNVTAVNVVRAQFLGTKELDDVHIALHLAQAQKLLFGADPPKVTALALQLHRTNDLPAARARLQTLLPTMPGGGRLEILDFETLTPFYGQTLAMFAAIFSFISVLIGGIVLFTVSNTMSMAVMERTAEIGTLRAIGLRRGNIRAVFVTEGIVLGLVGAGLGVLAAILCGWAFNAMGFTWTPPGRVELLPLAVRVASEPLMVVLCAIGLVVVAALSAALPAARAARLNIVDALRHA